jgi:NADH dehydrogenase (ubiquinone) Fe-S protein 3
MKKFYSIIPTVAIQTINDEVILIALNFRLLNVLNILKSHISFQYTILSCISGVDFILSKYRFGVVYDLLSLVFNSRIRVKIFLDDFEVISSTTGVYINANWWEREIWDLYGVVFENHPDLRRILNDYCFEGFPLRKDFPLSGFIESKIYNNIVKQFSIQFSQEHRSIITF